MAKTIKAKVLLLDDDLDLQELIQDYFRPRGYDFICHASAEQGLNEVIRHASNPEPIDLVITDFRLPNMNGIELIEQFKKVAPHIPIILITAHSSLDLAVEAIEKGAYDFVVKPIQFPQLAISMERAVYFSRLQSENLKLRTAIESTSPKEGQVIAKSTLMNSVIDLAKRVAKSDATVLITGESGTGKEVLAQLIHASSPRAQKPFVAINCSAIPEALLESELFGHAKGSFTGADEKKMGLWEEANEGTLFLDEIGDLSLPLQAKLLRVVQERKIKRVGENQYRNINVRLLAATHKNLAAEVQAKRFREDLFFRLNVIPIKIPPVRDRREDILPLAEHFLRIFKKRNHNSVVGFSKKALQFLLKHDWKGNVRELENSIERAVVLCESPWIEEEHFLFPNMGTAENASPVAEDEVSRAISEQITEQQLADILSEHSRQAESIPAEMTTASAATAMEPGANASFVGNGAPQLLQLDEWVSLETLELRYINEVLRHVDGVKDHAAKILQIDRKTLYRKLEAFENLQQAPVPASPHRASMADA